MNNNNFRKLTFREEFGADEDKSFLVNYKLICQHIKKEINQKCRQHSNFLDCPDFAIIYNARTREFGLPVWNLCSVSSYKIISHCPWCGQKLPKSLFKEYIQEIAKILGKKVAEVDIDDWLSANLPVEFQTDEWWKKQGL